ncbi:hypothetical protein D0726_003436 [Escherichia coli]|nr:hypothetical protein [Escherichia coli]
MYNTIARRRYVSFGQGTSKVVPMLMEGNGNVKHLHNATTPTTWAVAGEGIQIRYGKDLVGNIWITVNVRGTELFQWVGESTVNWFSTMTDCLVHDPLVLALQRRSAADHYSLMDKIEAISSQVTVH